MNFFEGSTARGALNSLTSGLSKNRFRLPLNSIPKIFDLFFVLWDIESVALCASCCKAFRSFEENSALAWKSITHTNPIGCLVSPKASPYIGAAA